MLPRLRRAREGYLVGAIALGLCLLIGRRVLFSPGIIILAENLEVYSLSSLIQNYTPYWQEKFQYFDFGIGDSVYLYGLSAWTARLVGLSYVALERLLLLAPHGLAFATMYLLVRYIIQRGPEAPTRQIAVACSVTAAMAYALNPWIAVQPRDIALRFDYALTPLLLMLYMRSFRSPRAGYRDIIAASLVLSLTACLRYLAIVAPVLLLYLLIPNDRFSHELPLRGRLRMAGVMALCFGILSLGKFLSPALYVLHSGRMPNPEVFHPGMVGQATLLEVLSTRVLNSPARAALDDTYTGRGHELYLLVTATSLLYLVLMQRRPRKHEMFPPLLLVCALPLAVLKQPPFGWLNIPLLTRLPALGVYGRLLRYADWNSLPIVCAIAVMLGMTLRELLVRARQRPWLGSLLPVLATGLCATSAWPLLSGNLNGYWCPSSVPEEFVRVNAQLMAEPGDFKVLWAPAYWENRAEWAQNRGPYPTTGPTCNFDVRSSSRPSCLTERFYLFDYYSMLGPRSWMRPLEGYAGRNLGTVYSLLNVGYAVVHHDVRWNDPSKSDERVDAEVMYAVGQLEGRPGIQSVIREGCLSVVKLAKPAEKFRATTPVAALGGLPTLGSLVDAGVDFGDYSLVFLDSMLCDWEVARALLAATPVVVVKGGHDPAIALAASTAGPAGLYFPSRHAVAEDYWRDWSKARVQAGVGDPRFQEMLKGLQIDTWAWDFDQASGVAFTTARGAHLSCGTKRGEAGLYAVLVRYLVSPQGGALSVKVNGNQKIIATRKPHTAFEWTLLGHAYLSDGAHSIAIRNLEGLNAVNLAVLTPASQLERRLQEANQLLLQRPCLRVYEAETDLDASDGGCTIAKEIDASNGYLVRLDRKGVLTSRVDMTKPGHYRIECRLRGAARVVLGNAEARLVSEKLATVSSRLLWLDKGTHELSVSPVGETADVDVVWIGPAEPAGRLTAVLFAGQEPAVIRDCKETSRSEATVEVTARNPFLLTVANGYDPLVSAFVGNRRYPSIPVFGTIDGFIVDRTGDLDVKVRYTPQLWAEAGVRASLAGSLLLICYALWERWRVSFPGRRRGKGPTDRSDRTQPDQPSPGGTR